MAKKQTNLIRSFRNENYSRAKRTLSELLEQRRSVHLSELRKEIAHNLLKDETK